MTSQGRTYVVSQRHPAASDANDGSEDRPFKTVNRAAELAGPGDTVLVRAGVYRERVNPRRGGEEGRPVVYMAAPGEEVCIRGSEEFRPEWKPLPGADGVFEGSLAGVGFGEQAYSGQCDLELYGNFDPYLLNFDRTIVARPHSAVVAALEERLAEAVAQVEEMSASAGIVSPEAQKRKAEIEAELGLRTGENPRYLTTLGQVFVDGRPLAEVETLGELRELPGTWMVSPEGGSLWVHFPPSHRPLGERLVEIAVRHTCFAPLRRGLGYICVRGFVIEHGANHFPTWGRNGWAQVGLLSCRSGHHWTIERNTVRYAKGIGIDCGCEGGEERMESASSPGRLDHKGVGYHLIRDNHICDNGLCGIAGIGHHETRVLGNVIERNNRAGHTSPWWEFAGIKFHFFFDGRIEGNLIRDNDAHGIWIDNQWRGSRITRNVIVNNLWSGINVELGRGPVLIDNNVIAYTRQGDGVYGHDVADVTVAHNLIYANANFGAWFAYCTKRVKNEDGCWDIKVLNNMILGNRAGAVALPIPWECAGRNVSEGNLLMGGGEYLDEGSGPQPPLFQFTNKSHCGQFPEHCGAKVPMTRENALALFVEALDRAGVPEKDRPDLDFWQDHFLVSLELWRRIMGCDLRSRVARSIRDGLQSRVVSWQMDLDGALSEVQCEPVAGVDLDFLGRPLPAARPLPGPFQSARPGRNRFMLWPVRGVETSVPLT